MNFELSVAEFTGPIELLLDLIERRKLPINDISLSSVTDEYLAYTSTLDLGHESVSQKIHFIYVASTLVLIKSKSLLPQLELSLEEETDIESLKERLLLYQHFQEIAISLQKLIISSKKFYFPKEQRKEIRFQPHDSLQPSILASALEQVFNEVPELPQTKEEATMRISVHIEEIMNSIVQRMQNVTVMSFRDFIQTENTNRKLAPKEQKVFALVSFLALLEVVRNHGISVEQVSAFSDISVGTT